MNKKQFERDKHWDERRPGYDLDFVEVHVAPADFDSFIHEHAERFLRNNEIDPATYLIDRKRRDQMRDEIYHVARACLTDRQFEIFLWRYKFRRKEIDIARLVGTIQPYVSNTLKVCHAKIRRALNLEAKKKRGPRQSRHKFKKKPSKSTKKIVKKVSKKP